MHPSGILESALYVDDLDRAEAFYRDMLGLEPMLKTEGRQVFFRCGQGMLILFNPEATRYPPRPGARTPVPPHGASGPGHLCFRASAEEIETWKARLEENGIAIDADFRWPNGARSIYFRDPSGNSLEFAEPALWGFE